MILDIYSKDGVLKLSATPADGDKVSCGIQEETVLSISFTAFECVSLEVYDYVDLFGTRYILLERYRPKMNARGEWAYSIRMYGPESVAAQTLMVNPTDGTDNPQVTLTAPAAEHAALIVANLNRRAGTAQWQVGEVIDTPYIDIDYTGKYASDAISELATAANTEWWFNGFTLNISRCEFGEPIELEYGAILLSGISRSVADGAKTFTRLFPLGSSRNIDLDKYGYARLQLPDREAYIDSGTEIGIVEHFEENAFAGIYPRRIGKVGAVRSEVRKGEGEVDYTVWYFTDPDIPFNPNDYEIGGLVKNVTFQSGELRGRVFEVNYDTAKKEFEIITQWPYENGVQLPTPPLIPAAGDEYILWNTSMPESYYHAAEQEYLEAVEAYIAENQKDVSVFQAATDYTVVGDDYAEFRPGRRVRIVSGEYFPEVGYRDTRIISVSRSILMPGSMTLVMSDVLSTGKIQNIENGLNEIRGATNKISTSISTSNESLSRKLNRSEFYDLFEKVNIGTADVPKYAIRAKYGLYTEDFLTGRGRSASISGGGGSGASALSDLNDVLLSASLAAGDLLQYDGTHWINISQNSLKPDLSGYATQEWVENKGYALASSLAAHATDTSIHVSAVDRAKWDKAASDLSSILGSDSDTIINKWEEVVAFLDTYTEADTLANLLSNKADKATTLAGYGITDAKIANGTITLGANTITPLVSHQSIYTLTFSAGAFSAKTYNPKSAAATVNIPTTTAHIAEGPNLYFTDARAVAALKSTTDALNTAIGTKLDTSTFTAFKTLFDSMFVKESDGNGGYRIKAKYGLYTDRFLAARGQSASIPGGGGGGESYNRLDSWADYSTDKAGYVLSAGLGWDLNTRVSSLASGAAVSVTTTGGGNAITTLSKSGTVITATKGATFLTSHQSLDAYMKFILNDGYVAATFNANALAQKAASTYIEFWQSNAGWFNMKAGKYMIPNGTSSQFLKADGSTDDTHYVRALYGGESNGKVDLNNWCDSQTVIGSADVSANAPGGIGWYNVIQLAHRNGVNDGVNYVGQIALGMTANVGEMYFRSLRTGAWRRVLTSDNYASVLDVNYVKKTGDTMTGVLAIKFNATTLAFLNSTGTVESGLAFKMSNVNKGWVGYNIANGTILYNYASNKIMGIKDDGTPHFMNNTLWHAGNDGSGSGLDADSLDGAHLSDIRNGNVASATRLQGTYLLWGQSFYGNDVDGRLTLNYNSSNYPCGIEIFGAGEASIGMTMNGVKGVIGRWGSTFNLWYSGSTMMAIATNGNVGIGTTSPAYKLDVAGTIHSSVGVSSDGYVTARGQNSASDIRLKNHMEDVAFSVDQISDAPLWRFSWRRDGSIDVGSVAQYWRAVMPELTRVLPDGVHLGLDYGKAALLASVSLAREHRDLATRVAYLERENKQLKKLLKSA